MIRDSPSHIYHSALPLAPSSSWLRKCYGTEAAGEVRVLMGLPDRWDICSRTIHLDGTPAAFARCGDIIAVGIDSNVVLLDGITGTRMSVLSGHTDKISSLACSLDGTLLLSRSKDMIVKLWDVQTGGVIRTFGHDDSTTSASISPDGTTIAFGTSDGAIRLWDVRTWECHSIEIHRGSAITFASFSPIDSRRLLSSSSDGTVCQWDADGHRIGAPCREAHRVDGLAYSLDGTRFISWGVAAATVRDSESGVLVAKLDTSGQAGPGRCCLSPDGRFVACKADTIGHVWDITIPNPRLVGRFQHYDSITFLEFSPSLISGSHDRTVKFWQTSGFLVDPKTTDQMDKLRVSTTIKSVSLHPKDGIIVTSDSSGVVKTWDLATGGAKSSFSTPAKGTQGTHLAGDTLIIIWWTDEEKECHIWDVYKGQLLRTFHSSLFDLWDIKISGDGSKIFEPGDGYIRAVSLQTGEDVGRVELGDEEVSIFSVLDSGVRIGNRRDRGRGVGAPRASHSGEFQHRTCLNLVDWSTGRVCWIKDAVTKRQFFRLPERYTTYGAKADWDGRHLLVLTRPAGEAMVVDLNFVCPR